MAKKTAQETGAHEFFFKKWKKNNQKDLPHYHCQYCQGHMGVNTRDETFKKNESKFHPES